MIGRPEHVARSSTLARHLGVAGALVALSCVAWAARAIGDDGTPRLEVHYRDQHLSVEAHGVPLAEVLGEIAAKVGFTVVDSGSSHAPVTLSIREASTEEVLRQLLRAENHSLLYAEGSGTGASSAPDIDTIVLLGGQDQPAAILPEPGDQRPGEDGPEHVAAPPPEYSLAPPPAWSEPAGLASVGQEATPDRPADPDGAPMTVGAILATHALAGAPAAPEAADGAPATTAAPQPSLEAVLAKTTRRAQESLAALVDGLNSATRSLHQSTPAGLK